MPQMFPMPTMLLVTMASILFLFSMVRTYWHHLGTFSCLNSKTESKVSASFYQTW